MNTSLLRLVYSIDADWPYWRRRRLARRVRIMLDCSNAVWEAEGIEACLATAATHWQRLCEDYPADWVEIAQQEGVW